MNRPIYGNPATTPNPVADFNQNNPKKADYIKNRPFYDDNGVVKQLEEKFIPDSVKYAYESVKIGEAVPDETNVCFVECSEEIKEGDIIKVKGYFEDGVEEYVVTVPSGYDGATEPLVGDAGRLGLINMPIPTTITFTCIVKGEVFKVIKKPISDTIQNIYSKFFDIPIDKGNAPMSVEVGFENIILQTALAAFAAGYGNKVTDKYGVALCRATEAAYAALAVGLMTKAGAYSLSSGMYTEATANATFTAGDHTKATATCASATGQGTEAGGMCSNAQNFKTKAPGNAATSMGGLTVASGEGSNSRGWETEASGVYSDACGLKTKAKGKASHAGGIETTTEGEAAFTGGGYKNTVKADRGFIAGGQWCSISKEAPDALVHGIGCSATAPAQRVGGKYSKGNPDCAEIVGNGADSSHRSNAYELYWNGDVRYAGFVECAGFVMTSPNGTRYKVTINDDGSFTKVIDTE